MRTVQRGPAAGLAAQLLLLGVLSVTVGIGALGWLVGILYGVVTVGLLSRALHRNGFPASGRPMPSPSPGQPLSAASLPSLRVRRDLRRPRVPRRSR